VRRVVTAAPEKDTEAVRMPSADLVDKCSGDTIPLMCCRDAQMYHPHVLPGQIIHGVPGQLPSRCLGHE